MKFLKLLSPPRRSWSMALLAALVLIPAGPLCPSLNAQPPERHIPAVHGTTFADKHIELPQDLNGRAAVLVIGFTEKSRQAVTDWGKRLASDYFGSATVVYFEVPVLASVPRLLRGLVLGRIKASVSDRGRTTFLPLLDHEADWKIVTGYKNPDDAYILLIDDRGIVRWRTQGPIADQAYADLKTHLKQLQP